MTLAQSADDGSAQYDGHLPDHTCLCWGVSCLQVPPAHSAVRSGPAVALAAITQTLSRMLASAFGVLLTAAAVAAGTWHVAVLGFGGSRQRRTEQPALDNVVEGEGPQGGLVAASRDAVCVCMLQH